MYFIQISVLEQDIAFFDANNSGDLVARLTSDVQEFKVIILTTHQLVVDSTHSAELLQADRLAGSQERHAGGRQCCHHAVHLSQDDGLSAAGRAAGHHGGHFHRCRNPPHFIRLLSILSGSNLRRLSRAAQESNSVATGTANEVIGNIRTVRYHTHCRK